MRERSGGLFALLLGAASGFVAGLLLAPKSGKETREDIKEYAGEFGEKAGKAYQEASLIVHKKVKALKRVGKKIDKEKYMTLVNEVIAEFKNDGTVTKDAAIAIGQLLGEDWKKVSAAMVPPTESVKKSSAKKATK